MACRRSQLGGGIDEGFAGIECGFVDRDAFGCEGKAVDLVAQLRGDLEEMRSLRAALGGGRS